MSNLKHWEDKIKQKRKNTDFREFVKEIASWLVLNLYKREDYISKYPNTDRSPKIDSIEYLNNFEKGINYNSQLDLFTNYKTLFDNVYFQNVSANFQNENSLFSDATFGTKNTYLSFVIGMEAENILYSAFSYINVTNVFNSFFVNNGSQNIYFGGGIINSFNIFYSKYITNSSDIWFSTNLIGCQDCIFCNGLENKKYCIDNKEYLKEEYIILKNNILKQKDKFILNYEHISRNSGINYSSKNIVSGYYNIKCENIENGYWINNMYDVRNMVCGGGGDHSEYFYDVIDAGVDSNNFYGVCGSGTSNNIFCSIYIDESSYIYYSWFMENCSNCIGCIGLKNKSYCILNKQYTKEEWYELADKIFSQMEDSGTLGKFFPGYINPYYFNDTFAYLIDDSFTKQEVENEGYMWRESEINVDIPEGYHIIGVNDLSDYQGYDSNGNWQINPEILKKVIKDEKGNIYRIVQMEYDFLMKHGLPLPEIHWLDRIKMGFKFK
ncbi:MAG: hypothetical protein PHS49_02305 [Candidatus Gracilibacteria bacterium]|nr:hypothetical protein [Candidatus Gracilibacteria bacterium]